MSDVDKISDSEIYLITTHLMVMLLYQKWQHWYQSVMLGYVVKTSKQI